MALNLKLRDNNLYATGELLTFPNGDQLLERKDLDYTAQVSDDYHRVMDTDTLDYIAWLFYQEKVDDPSKYWWIIAEVNDIENPFDISEFVGKDLLVPDIFNIKLIE